MVSVIEPNIDYCHHLIEILVTDVSEKEKK